jgi:signal transduction histidine kinase
MILGILFLTLFLYDVPLRVFFDGALFTFFLVVVVSVFSLVRTYGAHVSIVQLNGLPLFSLDKKLPDRLLIEQDFSALIERLTQEYLTLMNGYQLEQQQLVDYYSMWSHQIKVPLSVLDLMVQSEEIDGEVMKEELMKINQYLDMILQYIRMNHTETDYVLVPVSLERLVRDSVKKYARFFIKKDLSLVLGDLSMVVVTDEKWLSFVFEQVLFNALKYTSSGRISIFVEGECLVVQDTGIGIMTEDLPRIFENGYTGFNGRRDKKASGLGLFMSKQILDALGHRIAIESVVGEGTRVLIDFSQREFFVE